MLVSQIHPHVMPSTRVRPCKPFRVEGLDVWIANDEHDRHCNAALCCLLCCLSVSSVCPPCLLSTLFHTDCTLAYEYLSSRHLHALRCVLLSHPAVVGQVLSDVVWVCGWRAGVWWSRAQRALSWWARRRAELSGRVPSRYEKGRWLVLGATNVCRLCCWVRLFGRPSAAPDNNHL